MGRTLPSAAIVLMQEEASFARFRRALRRADQLALDDLFTAAKQHTAEAQYASHALPFEIMLLSMLLEEHKEVMRLREKVETLSEHHRLTEKEVRKWLEKNENSGPGIVDPGVGFDDDPQIDNMEETNE